MTTLKKMAFGRIETAHNKTGKNEKREREKKQEKKSGENRKGSVPLGFECNEDVRKSLSGFPPGFVGSLRLLTKEEQEEKTKPVGKYGEEIEEHVFGTIS